MYEKQGAKDVVLHEVGPRFEMQLYQLRLGTLDQVRICERALPDRGFVRYSQIISFFEVLVFCLVRVLRRN